MGFAKDVLGFEAFNLKGIGRKIKDNPLRLLYGGIDPASTKVWNKVLGRDDEPLVDQWGGASKDTYKDAEAAGLNTGPGKTMHGIARSIAGSIAGNYFGGQLGMKGNLPQGQGLSLPGMSGGQQEPKEMVTIDPVSDYTPDMPEYQNLIDRYNSNEGPYADGKRIHLGSDGNAYLLGQDYSVLGRVPADNRLYQYLSSWGENDGPT